MDDELLFKNTTPIVDLHYTKLKEWLELYGIITEIHEGDSNLISTEIQLAKSYFDENRVGLLPPNIAQELQSDISYLNAKNIFDYLEQFDGNGTARNVFGFFKSDALKSWWNLLRLWEKDNIHIAHSVHKLETYVGEIESAAERKLKAAEQSVRTIDNRSVKTITNISV